MSTQNLYANSKDHTFIDQSVQGGEILSHSVKMLNLEGQSQFHLFSHGRSGELLINGKWRNAEQITHWLQKDNRLTEKSALAIYGCEFAKGDKGRAAVSYLESALGIPISASDDITGQDGDWDLEVGKKLITISPKNYPDNLQYIRITPDMFGITAPVDGYSNGSFEDISSHLGLPAGSVEVKLIGVDVRSPSGGGVYRFSLTQTGNNTSYFRFRLNVAGKIRIEHGSSLEGLKTDSIESVNGEALKFTTVLDSGLSHTNIGNSYGVFNSNAASASNSGGRYTWDAVNDALEFDVRVLSDGTGGNSDHWLLVDNNIVPQSCPVAPKIVFIVDDSVTIDDTERAEITVALQSIADKVQLTSPNAEFGVVQYGSPATKKPEDGSYNIVMGYTTNPTLVLPNDPLLIRDHLPDSIDQMITDNIFTSGALANPDTFFIFTDAARTYDSCCTQLINAGGFASKDAEPDFGEYSKLAALSTTGNVSLYHVPPTPSDLSPEIAQGNGVYQIGNFALAQSAIDSIASSLCSTKKEIIEQCYAITDNNTSLYKFDLDPNTAPTSVSMSRVFNGEALAYRATNNALYAFHQTGTPSSTKPSDLYKIELDGTNTLITTSFIDSRASGAEFISYSDGTEQLVILMRENNSKIQFFDATDLASKTPLKTLDLTYTDGSDVEHMDGLAVNPTTGEMLIMKSHGPGDIDPEIYSVNTNTGVITHKVTLIVTTPEIDAESFAFSSDGNAYTETEKGKHRIFRINLTTGALTEVENANLDDDIEGMACIGSIIKTPPSVSACFDPILVDDNTSHRIWKITGATQISDLTGENLNDGSGPDLIEVGSYDQGYNIQDLAYDNNAQVWGLASGTGANGHALGNAFIGQIIENAGVYSFTNVTDLGATYSGSNTGKALVWDPNNNYFIYDANFRTWTNPAALKAFDPATNSVVADPWGTGSPILDITIPTIASHYSIQGLAYAPDGTLYGIAGASGPSVIFTLEQDASKRLTGNVTQVGLAGLGIGLQNLEVIDFTPDGQLLIVASDTDLAALKGKVYTVDTNTGVPTEVADLDAGNGGKRDWEGIKFCNSPFGPKSASISGNVFQDTNSNDIFESSESGVFNISVWRQTVKSDGTLDPVKTTAITDVQGNYRFTNISDGDYHIFVDISDTDIPSGWLLGGTNPIVITINNKNSVNNANFPFDETVCTTFSGEVSEAALLSPNQVTASNKIIVPSTALSPREGHLRAYNLKADGQPDESNLVWDAASKMTTSNREKKLYTTDSLGTKINFKDIATISDNIKSYTLDPSFNSGNYLAGRKNKSFLGAISRGNGLSLLTQEVDTFKYLNDIVYQEY